ncbi:hypothetical protein EVAR_13994_1 [Eumeta japonica]|uniref:Uncharacterized protein n=1 Tax=Eumeta variegata TaxID=151549 RepID=A0A4C1U8H2_EUMVA|nr:hypothetical protein EVAR_13994_1 [Eumeta japonica]
MSEISFSHKTYWGLAKALKTEGAARTPALKRSDKSIAFDDREKAEYLADSIEHQCSDNPPYDSKHVRRVEEEVRHRVFLPPKDDLDPITHDEVSKHIKGLKIRKATAEEDILRTLTEDDDCDTEFMNTEQESDGDADYISAQSNTNSEVDAETQSSDSDSDDLPFSELQ